MHAEGPLGALELQQGQGFASLKKQHLVPFSISRQIVNKGGTRSTASPSNAIGNLAWLSRRQNGLDALSDRWTVMDPQGDEINLAARGMLASTNASGTKRTVLDVYEEISGRMLTESESWQAERKEMLQLYRAFCDGRADWIIDQMRLWLEEPLPAPSAIWLGE